MQITIHEFREACDTLVRFTQQHTGLNDEERELVVTVVQTLELTLAPSSSAATRNRLSLGRRLLKHPLIG